MEDALTVAEALFALLAARKERDRLSALRERGENARIDGAQFDYKYAAREFANAIKAVCMVEDGDGD